MCRVTVVTASVIPPCSRGGKKKLVEVQEMSQLSCCLFNKQQRPLSACYQESWVLTLGDLPLTPVIRLLLPTSVYCTVSVYPADVQPKPDRACSAYLARGQMFMLNATELQWPQFESGLGCMFPVLLSTVSHLVQAKKKFCSLLLHLESTLRIKMSPETAQITVLYVHTCSDLHVSKKETPHSQTD